MPSWKKLVVSGSDATLNSLTVTTSISSSIFSGSFVGDGSGLTGIGVDTSAFATTGSNNFVGDQVITGSLTISGSSTFTNIGPAVFSGSLNTYLPSGSEFIITRQVLTEIPVDLSSSANFETDLGNWVNDPSNAVDWTRDSGGTPSASTGPTSAQSGSFYVYVEGNSNSLGDVSILEHPYTSSGVSFYYHAYGADIGTLAYETFNDSTWTERFSVSGDQGNQWFFQEVAHPPADKTRFKYTAGNSPLEDIALDVVNVYNSTEISESFSTVFTSIAADFNINAQQITAPSASIDNIETTNGSYIVSKIFNDDLFVVNGLSELYNLTSWGSENAIIGGPRTYVGTSLGSLNTYIGLNGEYFDNPSSTTAVGSKALNSVFTTQHRYVTAVGAEAGWGMNGTYTTIVGERALFTIRASTSTVGEKGVFIGAQSGFQPEAVIIGGNYLNNNVAIGYQTMYRSYLSSSIAIGYRSNYSPGLGENRRGSLVTLLGPYTNVSQSANLINATGIGANVTLEQSNTVILGNNADVGIGTTTPTAKLEVSGSVVISDILTLEPTHPAPTSAPSGSIISSGSGAELKPYFWNGSTWTSMI